MLFTPYILAGVGVSTYAVENNRRKFAFNIPFGLGVKVKFAKINTDDNIETAKQYQVSGLPTLLVFKNGEPVERLVGLMPKSSIITNIEKHI